MAEKRPYQVFIEGEMINLCVPALEDIDDGWTEWFNDPETTRYLGFGVFPHHREDQLAFFQSLSGKDRFAVMIRGNPGGELFGTISLSSLDMVGRSAQISLVVGKKGSPKKLVPLEAMALVTRHAFEVMGLERVWAGQPVPGLGGWNHMLELLGYRTEGYLRRGFAKGRSVSDSVYISCLYEDFAELQETRGGKYWPGNSRMLELIRKLPKTPLASIIAESITEHQNKYFEELRRIEKNT